MTTSIVNLRLSLNDFYELEPREIFNLFRAENKAKEEKHILDYIAVTNAIGKMFSKNYKYQDVFKKDKVVPKELSEDDINALKEDLLKMK